MTAPKHKILQLEVVATLTCNFVRHIYLYLDTRMYSTMRFLASTHNDLMGIAQANQKCYSINKVNLVGCLFIGGCPKRTYSTLFIEC